MPRTHGKLKCSIWTDDDFLALPPEEKVLYNALFSHAGTSYAGVADWRPGRLAKLISPTATAADARRVAERLDRDRFLVVDEDTEEVLVRSFVRHDEIYKSPKIMVASVAAFAAISSPRLRRAYLVELHRLRQEYPDAAGWNDPRVTELLRRPIPPRPGAEPRDASTVDDQRGNPSANPSGKGSGNPSGEGSGNPSRNPSPNPSGKGFPTTTTTTTTTTRANALVARQRDDEAAAEPTPDEPPGPIALDGGLFPSPPEPDKPETAQTVIAWWIRQCQHRPPERTVGHVARELAALFDEGVAVEHIYRGMAAWMTKNLSPAQIANEVHLAMNGNDRPVLRAVSGGPVLYRNPTDPSVYDVPL